MALTFAVPDPDTALDPGTDTFALDPFTSGIAPAGPDPYRTYALDRRLRAKDSAANDALNVYRRAALTALGDYGSQSGQGAVDAFDTYRNTLEDHRDQAIASVPPAVLALLQPRLDQAHEEHLQDGLQRYGAQQQAANQYGAQMAELRNPPVMSSAPTSSGGTMPDTNAPDVNVSDAMLVGSDRGQQHSLPGQQVYLAKTGDTNIQSDAPDLVTNLEQPSTSVAPGSIQGDQGAETPTSIGSPPIILAQRGGGRGGRGRRNMREELFSDPLAPLREENFYTNTNMIYRLEPKNHPSSFIRDPNISVSQEEVNASRTELDAVYTRWADILANGHGFREHSTQFGRNTNREQFAGIARFVMSSRSSRVIYMNNGGTAFYDAASNTLVIIRPNLRTKSTMFKPGDGTPGSGQYYVDFKLQLEEE